MISGSSGRAGRHAAASSGAPICPQWAMHLTPPTASPRLPGLGASHENQPTCNEAAQPQSRHRQVPSVDSIASRRSTPRGVMCIAHCPHIRTPCVLASHSTITPSQRAVIVLRALSSRHGTLLSPTLSSDGERLATGAARIPSAARGAATRSRRVDTRDVPSRPLQSRRRRRALLRVGRNRGARE